MVSPTLLVLAAGMGSRYGGLKQFDAVGPNGEAIMDYSIFDALRAGFGKIVFVIRKDIEEPFKHTIGARFEGRIAVDYVFQELDDLPSGHALPPGRTKPWGTTHAILMAANVIHEPFAAINSDDFYGAESFRALAHHLQSGTSDSAMVGFTLRNTLSEFGAVARGVCQVDDRGFLREIVELKAIQLKAGHVIDTETDGRQTSLTGDEIVSMNMWGFMPEVFPQLDQRFRDFLKAHGSELKSECYIPSTVNDLIHAEQTRVKVLHSGDSWFGVTYREDHPRVVSNIDRLIEQGHYPMQLWS